MPPTYHNSNVQVLAGDHVEFKPGFFFLRGWVPGRVHYISGRPPKRGEVEKDDFYWVAIQHGKGKRISVLVVSETRQLGHLVRFVKRSDDELAKTAQADSFGD